MSAFQLLRLAEAAAILNVSPTSVRRLIANGTLRCVKPTPGSTRVRSDDLDAYVDSVTEPRPRRVTTNRDGRIVEPSGPPRRRRREYVSPAEGDRIAAELRAKYAETD